jgi:hypothetical protein
MSDWKRFQHIYDDRRFRELLGGCISKSQPSSQGGYNLPWVDGKPPQPLPRYLTPVKK